jgi:flavin reductase (DIM6/NTAB) family NADH-FMN oxidoreductase RutF
MTHTVISPAILYWGTPVVIVSSENEDGTTNLSPISSAFWLGGRCVLGFDAGSKTPQNIIRTGQCVVNLPDDAMAANVNGLARTTGTFPVPPGKVNRGYSFVGDKWAEASLTPAPSDLVRPDRVLECPVQMECTAAITHPMMSNAPSIAGVIIAIEVAVARVHVKETLRMEGYPNRIDPDKWRPMIMSFQEFYGLRSGKLGKSKLGEIEEEKYRLLQSKDEVIQEAVQGAGEDIAGK